MDIVEEMRARQEIHDLMLRYCRAVDRADYPAVLAIYAADGVDRHTGFSGPAAEYVEWLKARTADFDGTMHLIGNHQVEFFGEHAFAETYGTAVHWSSQVDDAAHNFTSGFRYLDHVRRDPEGWRIVERHAVREWTRSDAGRMVRPEGDGPRGWRGPGDPLSACRDQVRRAAGALPAASDASDH
ncbi:nuclear transport factor 2 family protein [Microbacterium sp.]|uniref:nuclear transport factor 2 family protein n=1 Tax=Microbacterium sp. TaxID=51671 RepID=UPI002614F7DB|nr:nuclear transport factor 2 family protein [Microbacterium sp.]